MSRRVERISNKLEDTWVGTIVFNDDTELNCKITYNPLDDGGLLLIKTDSTNNFYGPNIVKSFSFYDDQVKGRRYFYSLLFNNEGSKKYFFELLYGSENVSILSRNDFTATNVFSGNPYSANQKTNNPKVKKHNIRYLLDHRDNKMYGLSKSQILRMTEDKKEKIINFIKQEKLFYNENKVEDYISVIDYYSDLKTKP